MRITSKGQVTIPQSVREETGLLPHSEVEFVVEKGAVRLVKVSSSRKETRGKEAVRRLRGSATSVRMTTDEILALTRSDR